MPKTYKWMMTKMSLKKLALRSLFFLLLLAAVSLYYLFQFNFLTSFSSIILFLLASLALKKSKDVSTEEAVNEELQKFNVVLTSEGKPVLSYSTDGQLTTVKLGRQTYDQLKEYVSMGDSVYMAYFEVNGGWIIVVIEGKLGSKNQKAIAFRSVASE